MNWALLQYFAIPALILWGLGALTAWKDRYSLTILLTSAGTAIFAGFITLLWISIERPPLRTMGETRLWYTLLISIAAIVVYGRWRYRWILIFALIMEAVFICVNLFKPEIHSKSLMPALQSGWFAPHVIVYMFSYALSGAAATMAAYLLWFKKSGIEESDMMICDNLIRSAVGFITIAMLFGAIWAEEAWGNYWEWDPKETWAAITWLSYLGYIHLRRSSKESVKLALYITIISFILLQICWYGINYLPSAQGTSIHTYNLLMFRK